MHIRIGGKRRPLRRMAAFSSLIVAAALAVGVSTAASAGTAKISGTIRFSMLNYDPGVQAWVNTTIKAFEKLHPGVTVDVTLPPTNSYQDLLTTQVKGGNPPDIAAVATAWVPAYANAGALVPWTKYLGASTLGKFNQSLLKGAKYKGALYALPYLATARGLFYNETEFAKAGIAKAPSTWDQLVADAKKLQSSGAAKYGFALQGEGVEDFAAWFPYVYWSYGGKFTTATGKRIFSTTACVKGLSILNTMVNKAKIVEPNVTSNDLPQQMNLFTSGDAAMTITGPWLVGTLQKSAPSLKYGVAPIPAGATRTTLDVQDAFILFKKGKNPSAAAEFARYLFSPKVANSLVKGRGMLPVLKAGANAPRYKQPALHEFVKLLPTGTFVPQDPNWSKVSDQGGRAMQSMYVNGTSPAATCNTIRKSWLG